MEFASTLLNATRYTNKRAANGASLRRLLPTSPHTPYSHDHHDPPTFSHLRNKLLPGLITISLIINGLNVCGMGVLGSSSSF